MAKDFGRDFKSFQGQAKDIRLHDGALIKRVREGGKGEPSKDIGALYPFMPKCSQMFFDLPKIQSNPFERITSVYGAEYGNYAELVAIGDPNFDPSTPGATSSGGNIPNRTQTDACIVYDRIKYTANYLFLNMYTHFAYIDQREGRKGFIRNASDDSMLAAITIMSKAQEESLKRKAFMSRLFSDCLKGTVPAIVGGDGATTKSDGTGTPVTDSAYEVSGWAGKEVVMDGKVPELTYGNKASGISAKLALELADEIINAKTYGKYLSNYYVPGNRRYDKFTKPVLVIEEPVLNALNKSFLVGDVGGGTAAIPRSFNSGWSEYITDKGIEILTTDIFDSLPGGNGNKRLLAALVEPDHFKDIVYRDDMWSDICLQPRGVVYDYQRVEALGVDVRRPSCVFTIDKV